MGQGLLPWPDKGTIVIYYITLFRHDGLVSHIATSDLLFTDELTMAVWDHKDMPNIRSIHVEEEEEEL